ncbi:hypothetical protein P152DRAFT_157102 [Eremomyces bilateralis CBS 781.70]|uniref:Uncharacterized protein n=1 Tax=Eremomyces bilateralis CBS 781.70 TaxID=1392243 RepID=A0A6G1FVA1_9PEZI|nr:uncharacterized protein P152DRAFT_157102 [Eremomyces bilateralis CBS 781.70]KAF1809693.1 hypothetical protein P152DRAFT_157102 [Eremomyces bilateralis CBS 781.70]
MLSASRSFGLALLAIAARRVFADEDNPCKSFGIDFQDKESYFQNLLSTDPFTFVQQFSGCNDDFSYNILADPNGDQVLCSDTPLIPDNTNQMSTCPTLKNELFSGLWSIIIMSNNGDSGMPIAYQRDFSLSVGPQITTTYTPTITALETITPTSTAVIWETDTLTETLPPKTTAVPRTVTRTVTVRPKRVTTTTTKTLLTLKIVKPTIVVTKTTKTITATCSRRGRQNHPDPTCHILPTVIPVPPALQTLILGTRSIRIKGRDVHDYLADKERFVRERRDRFADLEEPSHQLEKRAPDQATLTVTDTDTAHYPTTTNILTASPPIVITETSETTTTTTSTPPPVTIVTGRTQAPAVTVTLPTPTKTKKKWVIARTTSYRTYTRTVTITTRVTPSSVKTACNRQGGVLWG